MQNKGFRGSVTHFHKVRDTNLIKGFDGIIADIRIYDRVLSAGEIQQLSQDTHK
jgi:hypothetical protein